MKTRALVGCPTWLCVGQFVHLFDHAADRWRVAYGLSNLVELIISCRSPVLTLCEQYSYFSIVFHVQPIRHTFDSI